MSALRKVRLDLGAIGRHRWREYAVRMAFGGAVTVMTGLIAMWFGPVVAGLFLAFPAILPASVTLVEKHDGDEAASEDAAGAAAGGIGLAAFGAVVWWLGERLAFWEVLALATLVWMAVALTVWVAFEALRGSDQQDDEQPTARAA